MNIDQIEEKIKKLFETKISEETFLFDFLLAYGLLKASISRLKSGDYNQSKTKGEVLWKKRVFFKTEVQDDLHELIDNFRNEDKITKEDPRFVIITDFKTLLSIDRKTQDSLDIPIKDLPKHFDFFLPLSGMEKIQIQNENLADRKAAEKLGKLHDLIYENNSLHGDDSLHSLNIFLSRLLFCFFAEDTGIFSKDQFTNAIASHTTEDGSDLSDYLSQIFKILSKEERSPETPQFLSSFPYVNGGLFKEEIPVPNFSRKSRKIIIECGSLNWKAINPDIFGSMIQAVVHRNQRSNLGIHYTSVENIKKVIQPLFLDDLYDQFEKYDQFKKPGERKKKLNALLERIYRLRIFDPACGSGNFLIIAYKELCRLEIKIFKQLYGSQMQFRLGNISLSQFYGIEIDGFAHETAKLSLYLAEHQMNLEFEEVFGEAKPTLPLGSGGNIVCGNATRLDWERVCPKDKDVEIYILGNPPYLGTKYQNKEQKHDLEIAAKNLQQYKNLDYIACWFIKAGEYIGPLENVSFSFVSTNSICQGRQVMLLWPYLFNKKLEISFAYTSFRWTNNARGNAGVSCVVLGLRKMSNKPKYLYNSSTTVRKRKVENINPYLIPAQNIIISKRSSQISNIPNICMGSSLNDDGNLTLSPEEKEIMINGYPKSEQFILKLLGSKEFIRGKKRFCIWINDKEKDKALDINPIKERINAVKKYRLKSRRPPTQRAASKPHAFAEIRHQFKKSIVIPKVSSERRLYIPIDFLDKNTVISNLCLAVYTPSVYIFAIIASRMHMNWVRAIAGRMKTDYQYSASICYNTFPFPEITDPQKRFLEGCTFKVLDEREKHSEKTLAQLYDPDKMPEGLRKVHAELDVAVERCYRPKKSFASDAERLEHLFELYEEMIQKEKEQS